MSGESGLEALRSSLSLILLAVSVGISGTTSLMRPPGIVFLEVWLMIWRNFFSALWTFSGSGSLLNLFSVMSWNLSQLAFLKFTYFLKSLLDGWMLVFTVMIIGK